MTAKYLSDAQLESMAHRLLGRYESRHGPVCSPPTPVERIVEEVLDLAILWEVIDERPDQTILAALYPALKTVVFNEARRDLVMGRPGLYNTILAHEAGHWEAHVDHGLQTQPALPQFDRAFSCLYRSNRVSQDLQESQAHKFMGYLLMPLPLLSEAVRGLDLCDWSTLYNLRDSFGVTISALKVRLERLDLLYVSEDRLLYPSKREYEGQLRLA